MCCPCPRCDSALLLCRHQASMESGSPSGGSPMATQVTPSPHQGGLTRATQPRPRRPPQVLPPHCDDICHRVKHTVSCMNHDLRNHFCMSHYCFSLFPSIMVAIHCGSSEKGWRHRSKCFVKLHGAEDRNERLQRRQQRRRRQVWMWWWQSIMPR